MDRFAFFVFHGLLKTAVSTIMEKDSYLSIFRLWTSIFQVVFASKWIFICTSPAGIKISETRRSWIEYTINTLWEEQAFFDGISIRHGCKELLSGRQINAPPRTPSSYSPYWHVPYLRWFREPAIRLKVNAFMLISCQQLLDICDPHRSTYEHIHTSSAPRPRGYTAPSPTISPTLGMSNSQLSLHTGPVPPSFLAFSSAEKPHGKASVPMISVISAQWPVRCHL